MLKFRRVYAIHGSGQTHADSTRFDPLKVFRFIVEVTGKMTFAKSGFHKCSGLKMKTDVTEYREGGDDITVIKTPGLVKFDPVTLERGMSADGDMWTWAMKSFDRSSESSSNETDMRAQVAISVKNRNGSTAKRYECPSCWVSSYETGDLDATSSNVLIEKLEFQHEGFKLS
jgi:phage tail-like protein